MINEKVLQKARSLTASFLKNRRKELGLTQTELAEKVGMKQASIARIEAGKFYLTTKQLWIICEALNIKVILKDKDENE